MARLLIENVLAAAGATLPFAFMAVDLLHHFAAGAVTGFIFYGFLKLFFHLEPALHEQDQAADDRPDAGCG